MATNPFFILTDILWHVGVISLTFPNKLHMCSVAKIMSFAQPLILELSHSTASLAPCPVSYSKLIETIAGSKKSHGTCTWPRKQEQPWVGISLAKSNVMKFLLACPPIIMNEKTQERSKNYYYKKNEKIVAKTYIASSWNAGL